MFKSTSESLDEYPRMPHRKPVNRWNKGGAVAHRGWLIKQGGAVKNWKKRFCVLQDGSLQYYKDENDSEPRGVIFIRGQFSRRMSPDEEKALDIKNGLLITNPNRTFYLYGGSQKEADKWVERLRVASFEFPQPEHREVKTGSDLVQAVNDAGDGDIINLAPGKYYLEEPLRVKRPIRLQANTTSEWEEENNVKSSSSSPSSTPSSNSPSSKEKNQIPIGGDGQVTIVSRHTTIIDFTSPNAKICNLSFKIRDSQSDPCIEHNFGNLEIANCSIECTGGSGLKINNDATTVIKDSIIQNCDQYGVHIPDSGSCSLFNSSLLHNEMDGIQVSGHSSIFARKCKVIGNQFNGINVSSSGRVQISHCEVSENEWDGATVSMLEGVVYFRGNKFAGNGGYGLYVSQEKEAELEDNTIENNGKS